MSSYETVADLARRAMGDPTTITHGEIVRLAAFIIDHDEHVAAYKALCDAHPAVTVTGDIVSSARQPLPSLEQLGFQQHTGGQQRAGS